MYIQLIFYTQCYYYFIFFTVLTISISFLYNLKKKKKKKIKYLLLIQSLCPSLFSNQITITRFVFLVKLLLLKVSLILIAPTFYLFLS